MRYDPITNTFDVSEAPADGTLPHVMWHVTDICPLNCGFCFAPKTGVSVDSTKALPIIELLQSLGVQKVDVAGGEPGILAGLPYIITSVRDKGMHCTVTTSGVGRQENINYFVSNISRISRLIISIDGVGAYHDKLRHFAGAWRAATRLIGSVVPDMRKRLVRVNTVVTKPLLTSNGLMPLAEAITTLGIGEWCLIEPHPANAKPTFKEHEITAAEFQDACAQVHRSLPDFKLLVRRRELYSSYWVLHPDGMLRQHSDTPIDGPQIDLLSTPLADIKARISATKTHVPTGRDRA